MATNQYCRGCGAKNTKGGNFCTGCGTKMGGGGGPKPVIAGSGRDVREICIKCQSRIEEEEETTIVGGTTYHRRCYQVTHTQPKMSNISKLNEEHCPGGMFFLLVFFVLTLW